jgi:hypothetical protein
LCQPNLRVIFQGQITMMKTQHDFFFLLMLSLCLAAQYSYADQDNKDLQVVETEESVSSKKNINLTFHITDFGIEQLWSSDMKVGESFRDGHNQVFSKLGKDSQILIPMPTDDELRNMDELQLRDKIAETLINQVRNKIENGVTEFEVQLIENVEKVDYVFGRKNKKELVEKFALSAYMAIGKMVNHLERTITDEISIDATLGSNGTAAFVRSHSAWKNYRHYIRAVTLVDGRARQDETQGAINVLGADKVIIINTYGDYPGDWNSIAYHYVTIELLKANPGVTGFLLKPLDIDKRILDKFVKPWSSHVLSMKRSNAIFHVEQIYADGSKKRLGKFWSYEIHLQRRHKDYINNKDGKWQTPSLFPVPFSLKSKESVPILPYGEEPPCGIYGEKCRPGWFPPPPSPPSIKWNENDRPNNPPPYPPSKKGGVYMAPQPKKVDREEGEIKEEEVLESRPSKDRLFWDIPETTE